MKVSSVNIFLVKDDTLFTPPRDAGAVEGITAARIIEIMQARGNPVKRKLFGVEDLVNADEVFVSNSIIEISSIVRIEDKVIGDSAGHRVADYILGEYQRSIAEYVGAK